MAGVDHPSDAAQQLLRVASAVLGDRPAGTPSPTSLARPTPASLAAWRTGQHRTEALDDRLRVWASTAVAPEPGSDAPLSPTVPALDGYAIGVKDVIDVAGMPTRSGSPLTSPEPVRADAPVITRLRVAGAAIAGKTQCTEWALNDPAPTRNPWNPDRTPGGSSAGSAVALASGMCTATVDTQTAGDVLRPAAYNGVVGFKPTIGWTPTDGTQPVAPTIDTIGVMARRVNDAAAVAATIADDPTRFTTGPTLLSPPAGSLALVHAAHRVITFAECAAHHVGGDAKAPKDYGPRAQQLLDLGLVTPAHAYFHAQEVRREATERLAELFRDIDVLVLPVTPAPAPPRDTTGDSRLQIPWTLCGFPALALPSGAASGLPLAVQLVSAPANEATLLAVARWCEEVLDLRLTPPESPER